MSILVGIYSSVGRFRFNFSICVLVKGKICLGGGGGGALCVVDLDAKGGGGGGGSLGRGLPGLRPLRLRARSSERSFSPSESSSEANPALASLRRLLRLRDMVSLKLSVDASSFSPDSLSLRLLSSLARGPEPSEIPSAT